MLHVSVTASKSNRLREGHSCPSPRVQTTKKEQCSERQRQSNNPLSPFDSTTEEGRWPSPAGAAVVLGVRGIQFLAAAGAHVVALPLLPIKGRRKGWFGTPLQNQRASRKARDEQGDALRRWCGAIPVYPMGPDLEQHSKKLWTGSDSIQLPIFDAESSAEIRGSSSVVQGGQANNLTIRST